METFCVIEVPGYKDWNAVLANEPYFDFEKYVHFNAVKYDLKQIVNERLDT